MRSFGLGILAAAALQFAAPAPASEENFVYVDRMPALQGTLEHSVSMRDEAAAVVFAKDVFRLESAERSIVSHAIAVRCGSGPDDAPRGDYFVVAIQFLLNKPGSFAEVARYDYYHEVYVRDRESRIRLYAEMHGSEMAELTARFRPTCPEI